MSAPTPTQAGWFLIDGASWRPLRDGEPRRWGDRWLRLPDGSIVRCRSAGAIQRDAEAARRGCDALPMRPETQRGPFPPPVYKDSLRRGARDEGGLAAVFARLRAAPPPPPAAPPPGTTGETLRTRREALHLSQRDAAALAELSRGMVGAIESGGRGAMNASGAAYEKALAKAERALGARR